MRTAMAIRLELNPPESKTFDSGAAYVRHQVA